MDERVTFIWRYLYLQRWIYSNSKFFDEKTVLELGSGVSLAGILSAFYAKEVVLTDYTTEVLLYSIFFKIFPDCKIDERECRVEQKISRFNTSSLYFAGLDYRN